MVARFIDSFDYPVSKETCQFLQSIADEDRGNGFRHLSGWITAFCFWDNDGKFSYSKGSKKRNRKDRFRLNRKTYHVVDFSDIPSGVISVPVILDDDGFLYDTRMVAGSVGVRVTSSGNMLDESSHASTFEKGKVH